MKYINIKSPEIKSISLVAHDNMKEDLISWCQKYQEALKPHTLYATGTTGLHLEAQTELTINKLISGPLGGDQQIGALITEQKVDIMIFFWDPSGPVIRYSSIPWSQEESLLADPFASWFLECDIVVLMGWTHLHGNCIFSRPMHFIS